MCVCVCVYVLIKLHITAQSGPVILVILCHSHWSRQGGINDTCYENLWCVRACLFIFIFIFEPGYCIDCVITSFALMLRSVNSLYVLLRLSFGADTRGA